MLFSIAYRNIWRNRLRTWILISSIAVGMFAGIFSLAFNTGMLKKKTDNAIFNELSHLQTHKNKFVDMNDINLFFPNAYEKCIEIGSLKGVKSTTYRIIINSIISSEKATKGVKILGIVPEIEETTTDIHKNLVEGKYFKCHNKNSILVSQDMAERLHIEIESKVSLRFQDVNENISNNIFTVCGIFKTGNIAFDNGNVFVKYDDLRHLSGIPRNSAHEIAILLDDESNIENITAKINELFPYLSTENWKELAPILFLMNKSNFWTTYILVILILIGLSFGITNSMCMVILDRIKELGMLMAVGMNKLRIFSMLMLETIKITLLGGLAGIFLGMVAIEITGTIGLNITSYEKEIRQMGYDSLVNPYIYTDQLLWVILLVSITAVLSSIYPALKAMRYKPTDSIKSE
jgi:ABC-type lipoprotein release transport system permease subunit